LHVLQIVAENNKKNKQIKVVEVKTKVAGNNDVLTHGSKMKRVLPTKCIDESSTEGTPPYVEKRMETNDRCCAN
jgi:hypothetical protein